MNRRIPGGYRPGEKPRPRTLADRLFEPPAELVIGFLFWVCGIRGGHR